MTHPVTWQGGIPTIDLVEVFGPTPKQLAFLTSKARMRYYCAGRFAGKSWTCCLDVILQALLNPGVPGALLGRTEQDLKKVLLPCLKRHLETFRRATGVELVRRYSAGDMTIEFVNGSVLHWRGWEQIDRLRGYDLGWANVDEAEWGNLDSTTMVETLLPAIRVPCPRPGLALFSSPNGYRGSLKTWIDHCRSKDPSYWLTHADSWSNPHVSPEVIEACRKSMSERRFRTEIKAEALRPVGAVFDGFDARRHLIPWDWKAHRDHLMVFGIDFGTSHAAAVAVQVDPRSGRWVVVDELVAEPQTMGHWRDQVCKWMDGFGRHPYLIGCDRAIPEEINHLKRKYNSGSQRTFVQGLDSKFEQYVTTGVTYIQDWLDPADGGAPKLLFSDRLTRVADGGTCPLIPALEQYRYRLDLEGNPTDQIFKDNFTDHIIDALRYAVVYGLRFKELHGGILPSRASYRAPDGYHPDGLSGNNRAHF